MARTCRKQTTLAPELVLLGTILCIGVGDNFSTVAASEDHYSSHLVLRKVSLMERDVSVSKFNDDVASLAVVDCV